jgi:hypothetical protein
MYIKKFKYNSLYAIWESIVRAHIAFHKIEVPEQQIKCLIVFCMYGISEDTYDKLLAKSIVPKRSIILNYKTFLKEKGLLVKRRSNEWEVCEDLKHSIVNNIEIKVRLELIDKKNDSPK